MWGKNVRKVISDTTWAELRWGFNATTTKPPFIKTNLPIRVYQKNIYCHTCSVEGKELQLHEQWKYDDKKSIQRLTGLIPVCNDCHLSIHMGRANRIGLGEKARKHLAKVNGWTVKETEEHMTKASITWLQRSGNEYKLDITWLGQYVRSSLINMGRLKRKNWVGDRWDAIEWARDVLKEKDTLILDTETTGLLKDKNVEVIELAIMTIRGKIVYCSRFHPRYRIPKRTTDIHGITNEAVKNAPDFKDEYSKIVKLLQSKTIIAYNSGFDKGVISRTCEMNKLSPPDCHWECAMKIYRTFMGLGKYLPLPKAKHNSLDDCKATLNLIKRMKACKS